MTVIYNGDKEKEEQKKQLLIDKGSHDYGTERRLTCQIRIHI